MEEQEHLFLYILFIGIKYEHLFLEGLILEHVRLLGVVSQRREAQRLPEPRCQVLPFSYKTKHDRVCAREVGSAARNITPEYTTTNRAHPFLPTAAHPGCSH